MTIGTPPPAPNPADPSTFNARATAWVAWWAAAIPEINALSGMTNSGQFLDGLQTAPGITFTADPDTGIYRATSNQMAFATGGVKRALISTTAFVIDVPITGTAVMASDTDATAGKLMTVGAFGLGDVGPAPTLTAIDTTTTASGFYSYTTGATGTFPSGVTAATGGTITVIRESATKAFMLLQPTGTQRLFLRNLNTTWGAWAEFGAIGFTPVEQGGGSGMGTNKLRLGWRSDGLGIQAQVDSTPMGILMRNTQVPAGQNQELIAPGSPPVYGCRAWANFNGPDVALRGAGNLTCSRVTAGHYVLTFVVPMPDIGYAVNVTAGGGGAGASGNALTAWAHNLTTAGFQVSVSDNNTDTNADPTWCMVSVFR